MHVCASKSRMVSLTRDLGLPPPVFLAPPLDNVGAIGGFAPGDLALKARVVDCSYPPPPPEERPLILELLPILVTLVLVGLGVIPPAKLIMKTKGRYLNNDDL